MNSTQTLEAFHAAADRADVAGVKLRRAHETLPIDWDVIDTLNAEINEAIAETISLSGQFGSE